MSGLWWRLRPAVAAVTLWLPAGRAGIGAAAALLAVCVAAAGRARQAREISPDAWPREALGFLALAVVAALALPPIGRWGCAAAAAGLAVGVIAGRRRSGAAVAEALLGAGIVTAACAALQPLHLALWSRAQGWPPLALVAQTFANAAGWDARAWGATLALRDGDTVYRHALTAEAVLPFPLLCLGVLGAVLALTGPGRARDLLRFAAVLGLYCAARSLLLVRLTVEGFSGDLFWNPSVLALSVVAAAPLLERACPLALRRAGVPANEFAGWEGLRRGGPCVRPGTGGPTQGEHKVRPYSPRRRTLCRFSCGFNRRIIPRRYGHSPFFAANRLRLFHRLPVRAALLFLAVCVAAGLSAWSSVGAPKAGRMLIDESHSDWSSTLRPFDTEWFGNEATYNYASFAEYLNHFFRVSLNDREPMTPQLLANYDVLLVKMPTRAFAPAERAAIDAFVRRGGGLWLIGDHTNVFGTSTHLNALSGPMGIRFREDATWELDSGGPALWTAAGGPSAHPVLPRVSRFEYQTGCSLQASLGAEDLMTAPQIVARAADYATPNFFPQAHPNNFNGAFGPALLAAAARRGAGRLVAFTDSTSFSTFSMFATGRPELARDTIAWLNRRNRAAWPAWAAWFFALAAAFWLVAGAPRAAASADQRRRGVLLAASAGALTALLGGAVASRALAVSLVPPAPVRPEAPLRRVYFLTEGVGALFENLDPLYWNAADDPERDRRYTTFLVGTQRFGLVPTVVSRVPEFDPSGDLLVVAHPQARLARSERERLAAFVRRGGRVLVLPDNRDGGTSPAVLDDWLDPFGLRCGRLAGETSVSVSGAGLRLRLQKPFQFHGGSTIACDAAGRGVLARASLGRGFLLAAGDGQLFANATLGNHFDVPAGAQRDATELQLWLFRQLLLADRAVTRVFPPRCGRTDWVSDTPDRPAAPGARRRT